MYDSTTERLADLKRQHGDRLLVDKADWLEVARAYQREVQPEDRTSSGLMLWLARRIAWLRWSKGSPVVTICRPGIHAVRETRAALGALDEVDGRGRPLCG